MICEIAIIARLLFKWCLKKPSKILTIAPLATVAVTSIVAGIVSAYSQHIILLEAGLNPNIVGSVSAAFGTFMLNAFISFVVAGLISNTLKINK